MRQREPGLLARYPQTLGAAFPSSLSLSLLRRNASLFHDNRRVQRRTIPAMPKESTVKHELAWEERLYKSEKRKDAKANGDSHAFGDRRKSELDAQNKTPQTRFESWDVC